MPRRKTTEEFIQEARKVYGDRYDYSEAVYKLSTKKVRIICRKSGHGIFEITPADHLIGKGKRGCPICGDATGAIKRTISPKEIIKRIEKVHPTVRVTGKPNGVSKRVALACKKCQHKWFACPTDVTRSEGCPKCTREKTNTKVSIPPKELIKRVESANPTIKVTGQPKGAESKVEVFCRKCKHLWFTKPSVLVSGKGKKRCGCPKCALKRRKKLSPAEIVQRMKKAHPHITVVGAPNGVRRKVRFFCKVCENPWSTTPSALLGRGGTPKQGCPKCRIKKANDSKRLSSKAIIRRIEEAHPTIRVIGKPEGVEKKATLFCRTCKNRWAATPGNLVRNGKPNTGCPACSQSKGEKQIASFLEVEGLSYEREKRFVTCRNKNELPFDFYVPNLRVLVEYQGGQHFFPVDYFGGVKTLRKIQHRDRIKLNWARDNGYELITIRYDEDVADVLNACLPSSRLLKEAA